MAQAPSNDHWPATTSGVPRAHSDRLDLSLEAGRDRQYSNMSNVDLDERLGSPGAHFDDDMDRLQLLFEPRPPRPKKTNSKGIVHAPLSTAARNGRENNSPNQGCCCGKCHCCETSGPHRTTSRSTQTPIESRRQRLSAGYMRWTDSDDDVSARKTQRSLEDWAVTVCCAPCLLSLWCVRLCERMCGCMWDDEDCTCVRSGRTSTDGFVTESRETPLTRACHGAHPDRIAELIRNGEDANRPNRVGDTPLIVASSHGRADLVRVLLDSGADPNGRDIEGYSVLMRAVESGSVDVAYELLSSGADATARVGDGTTALFLAARAGHIRLIDQFIEHLIQQKQFLFIDAVLRSSLKKARRMGLEDLTLRLVRAGSNLNGQDRYGYTPLMLAAREGLADIVDEMLSHGASVAMQSRFDGDTALTLACSHGYHYPQYYGRTAKLLIDAGADVNHKTLDFGMTPLAYAVNSGNDELVCLLLRAGADPNHVDKEGLTPLIRAVWKRDESQSVAVRARVATALLRGGASVNTPDRHGRTPLHAAVERSEALPQSELLIMLLIQAGASRQAQNKLGLSPIRLDRPSSNHHQLLTSYIPSLKLLSAAQVRSSLRKPPEGLIGELPIDKAYHKTILEGFLDGLVSALQKAEAMAQQTTGTLVAALQDQIDAAVGQ